MRQQPGRVLSGRELARKQKTDARRAERRSGSRGAASPAAAAGREDDAPGPEQRLASGEPAASWRRDPLSELASGARQVRKLQAAQAELVRESIERGSSWAEIGRALGVSRQAARKRFGGTPG